MSETWTWIAATGATLRLSQLIDGIETLDGIRGRHMPPTRRDRTANVDDHGTQLTSIAYDTRTLELPILIRGASESELYDRIGAAARALAPHLGDGTLRLVNAQGDTFDLVCRCFEGLELDETMDGAADEGRAVGAFHTKLIFEADRPLWRGAEDLVQTFTSESAPAFFPIFPLRLGASSIFAVASVSNPGDMPAQPVWTLTGPMSNVRLENITTGRSFVWADTLAAGATLVIDTRYSAYSSEPRSARDNAGANRWPGLDAPYDLWPIRPGAQSVRITASGTDGNSAVELAYRPLYLVPIAP